MDGKLNVTQKRPRGRPPTGESPGRSIRLTPALWAALDEIARAEGVTVSAVVRRIIERHFEPSGKRGGHRPERKNSPATP